MVTNANMSMSQIINGQQNDVTSIITGKMAFKVTAIKDTVYEMEGVYNYIRMQMNMAAAKIDMNSDKKDSNDILSTLMANFTNKPFPLVLSKTGRVISIGVDQLIGDIFNGITQINEAQKVQIKNQLLQSFGAKAFKGSIEMITAIFPDVKVAKGDQWVVKTKLESGISANINSTYALNDITPISYLVHGDALILPTTAADYRQMNGMNIKYNNVKGTMITDLILDKETGWTSQAKINQHIKVDIEIQDNPNLPGGMTIPMTITSEQTISDK
jgi:hypothetical protein